MHSVISFQRAKSRIAHSRTSTAQAHLEKTGGRTRHGRLRILWYRLRLTVQEMNYATRRLTELQTSLPEQRPPASNVVIITQASGGTGPKTPDTSLTSAIQNLS